MSPVLKNLSVDNIKLIYEFDKSSPLFTRVAHFEMSQGNYLSAIDILENGLKIYPDYPSAYIIYALALAYAGNEYHAKENLEKGTNIISSPKTFEFYSNKIDKILAERNSLSTAKRPAFVKEEETLFEEKSFFNFEDRLDELAEKLNKAKIKVKENEDSKSDQPVPEFQGKTIASETLAGIYLSQKNYEKAISVYKELMLMHPDREHKYTKKIIEIETLM